MIITTADGHSYAITSEAQLIAWIEDLSQHTQTLAEVLASLPRVDLQPELHVSQPARVQ